MPSSYFATRLLYNNGVRFIETDVIGHEFSISTCGGDFSPQVIRWSIITTSEKRSGVEHVNRAQHRKERHTGFYMKKLNQKKQ